MNSDPPHQQVVDKAVKLEPDVKPAPKLNLGPQEELPGGAAGSTGEAVSPTRERDDKAQLKEVDVKAIEEMQDSTAPPPNNEAPGASDIELIRKRLNMDQSQLADLQTRFKSVLDSDSDGGIDMAEFMNAMPELGKESPALAKRLFQVFDHDNSGKISVEELVASLASLCQDSAQDKADFVFTVYDSDKDGFVTKEELAKLLKSYFGGQAAISAKTIECYDLEEVDLDAEEDAVKLPESTGGHYDVLAQLDGSVADFVAKIFEGDTNADGKLSRDEFKAWLEKETEASGSAAGTAAVKWIDLLAGNIISK